MDERQLPVVRWCLRSHISRGGAQGRKRGSQSIVSARAPSQYTRQDSWGTLGPASRPKQTQGLSPGHERHWGSARSGRVCGGAVKHGVRKQDFGARNRNVCAAPQGPPPDGPPSSTRTESVPRTPAQQSRKTRRQDQRMRPPSDCAFPHMIARREQPHHGISTEQKQGRGRARSFAAVLAAAAGDFRRRAAGARHGWAVGDPQNEPLRALARGEYFAERHVDEIVHHGSPERCEGRRGGAEKRSGGDKSAESHNWWRRVMELSELSTARWQQPTAAAH